MEFVVVWKRPKSKSTELKWEFNNGVWWLEAPSKFSRKTFYPEIIKFFMSRGKRISVYVDDDHRGHGFVHPERFLEQLNCKMVRIQGGCTGKLQPADIAVLMTTTTQ